MKTRGIVFVAPGQVELREIDVGEPGADEVLIETLYTSISPGTEMRLLSGLQSDAPFPLVAGYALVGRVMARGRDAGVREGQLVFSGGSQQVPGYGRMWGGHVGHAVQAASKVFVVPENVDPISASLIKLSAIALHGVRCAPPMRGDKVAVVGLGPIGQLSARHYALSGADVLAVDLVDWRAELARDAGVKAFSHAAPAEAILHEWPEGADIIVDCTGVPSVVPKLIPAAKELPWDDPPKPHRATTYVVQGSFVGDVAMDYFAAFMKELRVVIPRDHIPQDIRQSIGHLASGELKVRDLVTQVSWPEDAPAIYGQLADRSNRLMTVTFDWSRLT